MRCEVCGRPLQTPPLRVIIEGSKLLACPECGKHASSGWKEERRPPAPAGRGPSPGGRKPAANVLEEDYGLVEGYGLKVKRARESQGLSQEALAKKINEKASLISKIETGKIVPSPAVVKKLEHVLDLTLLKPPEPGVAFRTPPPQSHALTLGDVVVIKKREAKNAGRESSLS